MPVTATMQHGLMCVTITSMHSIFSYCKALREGCWTEGDDMPLQVCTDQTHRASEYDWLDGYVLSPSVMHMPLPHVRRVFVAQ